MKDQKKIQLLTFTAIFLLIAVIRLKIDSKPSNYEMGITEPIAVSSLNTAPDKALNDPFVELLCALAWKESHFDPNAYNESENAAGIFQIRPIYVKDVNRILGREEYSLEDRYSVEKSTEMLMIYWGHYAKEWTIEELAAIHCAGPDGYEQFLAGDKKIIAYVGDIKNYIKNN